ncbi:MAG TPA: hypothetical protein DEH11_14090, partial [Actinobacteria bacterium]|nr:hypothetical protein [Actinomycetota bacterium]
MRALGRDGQRPARQDPAPRRAPSGQVGSHRRTAMPPVTKRDDSKPGFPVAGGQPPAPPAQPTRSGSSGPPASGSAATPGGATANGSAPAPGGAATSDEAATSGTAPALGGGAPSGGAPAPGGAAPSGSAA